MSSLSKKNSMNKPGKVIVSLAASYIAFKIISIRPIRNYLLGTAVDTAYYMIKRKLKS